MCKRRLERHREARRLDMGRDNSCLGGFYLASGARRFFSGIHCRPSRRRRGRCAGRGTAPGDWCNRGYDVRDPRELVGDAFGPWANLLGLPDHTHERPLRRANSRSSLPPGVRIDCLYVAFRVLLTHRSTTDAFETATPRIRHVFRSKDLFAPSPLPVCWTPSTSPDKRE